VLQGAAGAWSTVGGHGDHKGLQQVVRGFKRPQGAVRGHEGHIRPQRIEWGHRELQGAAGGRGGHRELQELQGPQGHQIFAINF
jgi:hypothetical protein